MALSTQRASTSIPLASSWKYDVFLSFRGETRKNFTAHLYKELKGKTIKVFIDEELERGTNISSELLTAITESRFALIIFSPDYASSKWCLDELVKIYECMQERKTIIPIFYNVDPSHVRNQTGTFAAAFEKHHIDGVHKTKVQQWKAALNKVGHMSGWNLGALKTETEFIEDIVESLYKQLVCYGCKRRIGDGFNCLNALWHRECLRCKGCGKQFTGLEFWMYGNQPYHTHCYERKCLKCNVCKKYIRETEDGQVEYMEHPFWKQIYCPSHVQDGTPRCCSCERLKQRGEKYYSLADNRKLCPQCTESINSTDDGHRSICLEVQNFYKNINVKVENIPVRFVWREDINEAMQGGIDGSDRQFPVIRAVCLLEERSGRRRSQLGYEVEEILILYGLPRILTGLLLAQEMMSAWLTLNRCPNLSHEVEKGICRYIAFTWLEYASNFNSSRELSDFEKELVEFRKSKIKGEALQRARNAERNHGLEMTLKTIRKTGNFPS